VLEGAQQVRPGADRARRHGPLWVVPIALPAIQRCSSGGTAWLVSCPPIQSVGSDITTRSPCAVAATPQRPPPATSTSQPRSSMAAG
jgi:hypothetical protein